MADVLVTGGAGYIGSAVTDLLVARGHHSSVWGWRLRHPRGYAE